MFLLTNFASCEILQYNNGAKREESPIARRWLL